MRTKKNKIFVEASGETCFWVHEGGVLKNLRELRDALASMSDMQFAYHTEGGRNDFAKWIEEVLLDAACGRDVRKAKTREKALAAVEKHLALY